MYKHINPLESYKKALKTLNSLQNGAKPTGYNSNKIEKMNHFLKRSGIKESKLYDLSIIHVSGTKGKGSTCTIIESILRNHGYKTGFYTSPHLVEVVERIRINGKFIHKEEFSKCFFEIYKNLLETDNEDMPGYFQMLTLVAFKVFIDEKIDVAIIEVGIGGEYDSTNIFKNVSAVGITSLGIDHVTLLGNTIESIAWHKGGIMKKGCPAFTIPQIPEAMEVLNQRSLEKECILKVVEDIGNKYYVDYLRKPHDVFNLNLSLAVTLCIAWLQKIDEYFDISNFINSNETKNGIINCQLSGRFQKLVMGNINYYLDGAHTLESITHCINWFEDQTKNSKNERILIFNSTGNRNIEKQTENLQQCFFDKVLFVPNIPTDTIVEDFVKSSADTAIQLDKCENLKSAWLELMDKTSNSVQEVSTFSTIQAALDTFNGNKYDVLITGSMHLVGCVLYIIDPSLAKS